MFNEGRCGLTQPSNFPCFPEVRTQIVDRIKRLPDLVPGGSIEWPEGAYLRVTTIVFYESRLA